jgi:hypothetical protein
MQLEWGNKRSIHNFGLKPKGRNCLDLDIDGMIVMYWFSACMNMLSIHQIVEFCDSVDEHFGFKLLNIMIKLVVLLLCIQNVLVLDLNIRASYLDLIIHGFPQSLQANAENALK